MNQKKTYQINGTEIKLEIFEGVFSPTEQGIALAKNVKINAGEKVIDIGTGSGILAILAAKKGAKVVATDISKKSIDNSIENAIKNKVQIDFELGEYFAKFDSKFDVIIANLPQTIVYPSYKSKEPELSKCVDGSTNGNEVILEFLTRAKKHMHPKTRIYLMAYTVTNYKETLIKILQNFETKLLDIYVGFVPQFVEQNIKEYENLNRRGKITLFTDGKNWKAIDYILELQNPKN